MRALPLASCLAFLACGIISQARAAPVFSNNFNSYSSNNTGVTQYLTGLNENYGGWLTNWTSSRFHALHAVDL